jgi:hypothetical protein
MMATDFAELAVLEVMGKLRIDEVGRAFYPRLVTNERPVENY